MKKIPISPNHIVGSIKILIIGGKGQMGKVFHRIFLEMECEVSVVDQNIEQDKSQDLERLVKYSNIVVIAVPLNVTSSIIERIAPSIKPDALLLDIASLKKPFMDKMGKLSSGEVIGTHPLFGPLEIIKGQSIAMITRHKGVWYPYIKAVFKAVGLIVVETDEKIHDRTMGIVQSLIHFISIALSASVNNEKKILGDNLNKLTTHYYLLHKNLAGRLLDQDPNLYADIAFLNENIVPVLENFVANFQLLIDFLKKNDRSGFINFFKKCSNQEEDKDKAYYLIERIMEYLAELEK